MLINIKNLSRLKVQKGFLNFLKCKSAEKFKIFQKLKTNKNTFFSKIIENFLKTQIFYNAMHFSEL